MRPRPWWLLLLATLGGLTWAFVVWSRQHGAPGTTPPSASEAFDGPAHDRAIGVVLAATEFEVEGETATNRPAAALVEIHRVARNRTWVETIRDPSAEAFHAAVAVEAERGIVTATGSPAAVDLWRRSSEGFVRQTLWSGRFGGRYDRMRDLAVGVDRDALVIAVATHDQGVVALLRKSATGAWETREMGRAPDVFVHEVELGDLDADGRPEVYATPSTPNRLDDEAQPGSIVRWRAGREQTIASYQDRHAKEILVRDVDGDGRDELYAVIEGTTSDEHLEVVRFDEGHSAEEVVRIEGARMGRTLVAGDVDGDGRLELALTTRRAGVWLLRSRDRADDRPTWLPERFERRSSGWVHAATFADVDGDGRDELYVADDDHGELCRYVWRGSTVTKTMLRRRIAKSLMTWSLTPAPAWLEGARHGQAQPSL